MGLSLLILSIVVSAQIDSTELWIGDQTELHLSATTTDNEQVEFPAYYESLTDGIEIVSQTDKDTIQSADGKVTIQQDITITAFKDSLFLIPSIPFVHQGDTFYTNPLSLNVIQPFQMDSTDNAITDIKPIYDAPIWWWGILRWVLLVVGIIGVGIGIFFLVKYIKKHTSPKGEEEPIDTDLLRPAEEVAIERLDKIKDQKIWQQGRTKEYYTELTDVLREYMARRFMVITQEKTSEEILLQVKALLDKGLFENLRRVLTTADLAKFAKWHPEPDENEQSLRFAYRFVDETTTQAKQEAEKASEDTEKQTTL